MRQAKIIYIFIMIFVFKLHAQTVSLDFSSDIETVKRYYSEKQFRVAEYLLQKMLKNNPNDIYALWLYGQIAHERGAGKLSRSLFERAIYLDPENDHLKADYTRTLLYSKQTRQAEKNYKSLINSDNGSIRMESYLMLAYINYWNQDINELNYHTNKILESDPENKQVKDLKEGVIKNSQPYLNLNFDYSKDDQPLETYLETVEVGMNLSKYINPKFRITNYNFNSNKEALTANIGNTFLLNKTGLTIFTSVGIYKNFSDNSDFTGELKLKQQLYKGLFVTAGINQLPYLSTAVSTKKAYTERNVFGVMEYQNNKILDFNFLYQYKFFKDNNHIKTLGGWVISRPVKLSLFEFRAGYGYGYSDSRRINFYPEKPIEALLADYPLGTEIPGIYEPYFTPKKQETHLVIGAIKAAITPKITVDVSGSYGFYATNYSPILFSNQDITGKYYSVMAFYKAKYHPYDIKANLNYIVSERLGLGAYFQHQENTFYSQNKAGAALNYKF